MTRIADLMSLREVVCVQCSKPNWDRLAQIRESISFNDVLKKLRSLNGSPD